ncbi:excalibur calcium-binding domain-containing protein [Sinomonas atrocyanea]|uniref:excalibur calcium-binding domain-containing protein n=1 Tax=Sinomonas atrocyanea TaxID=37927 RepID=UPI003D9704B5
MRERRERTRVRPRARRSRTAPTPSYENCGALRAAGIATLTPGEAGCSLQLHRNGDGIACN